MAIVHQVLGNCPGCGGEKTFGNVSISGNRLSRGCKRCNYWSYVDLPPVRKKVVYLDQSLLSGAFKGREQRAVRAVERVSELASKQLLVAPYSNIHEDETHQWLGYDGKTPAELMEFIEKTALGLEFKNTNDVEQTQAYKGFKAYLTGAPSLYKREERDAISGNIHEWHDYFYITVGGYLGDPELIGRLKSEAIQTLMGIFGDWRQSTNTFEQDVALEVVEAGRIYLREYLSLATRLASGDFDALLDAPVASQCVQTLLHAFPKEVSPEIALDEIARYFSSEYFAELPCEWLSARIFATIKSMVRSGAFAKREKALASLSGIFFDVQHIATYAPYSDAIFIDNQMANLVSKPSVGITKRFGTQIFCLNSIDQFMAWLDDIEEKMNEEHVKALDRAYGISF